MAKKVKDVKEKVKDVALTIRPFGSANDVVFIPTGIVAADAMLGGGIPRGKVIEIFGPYKSGKTLLGMEAIRAFQTFSPESDQLWIDAEHALDKPFSKRIGIDIDRLDYADDPNVNITEYVFEEIERWTMKRRSSAPHLIVLDSLASMGTVHEFETEMEKRSMDRAGQIYKGFRRVMGVLSKHNVTFIIINQVREKIGVYYGSPETTTGGKGPEFFASIRIRVSSGVLTPKKKIKIYDDDGQVIGAHIIIRLVKNRFIPEGQESEFRLLYMSGIDPIAGTLLLLANNALIELKGETFSYRGERIEDAEAFIDRHPDLLLRIWERYRAPTVVS